MLNVCSGQTLEQLEGSERGAQVRLPGRNQSVADQVGRPDEGDVGGT